MLTNGGLRTCLRTREGEMHPKSGVGTESTRRFRGGSTQTPPSLAARKPALTAVGCLLTIALLGGCAFAPPRVPVARYTLAPVAVQAVAALPPLQVTVQVAPWLDSTVQHYRLLDDDPLRIRRYAQSQWADKPTALLLARLHAAGEGSRETSGQPLRVTLRLTDFTQTFTRTLESVGRVAFVAEVALADGRVRRRAFEAHAPAPSADAVGGAAALSQASDTALAALLAWLAAGR